MNRRLFQRQPFPLVTAATAAMALAAVAGCQQATDQSGQAPQAAVAERTPVTAPVQSEHVSLTGCLQQGRNGVYILTVMNEPKQPDSSNPAIVAREKLAEAEAAYRLSADDSPFGALLGRRVRIEGTLSKPSDLVAAAGSGPGIAGTTGQSEEVRSIRSGRIIKQSDLAQVHVTSIERVASACGGPAGSRVRPARRH